MAQKAVFESMYAIIEDEQDPKHYIITCKAAVGDASGNSQPFNVDVDLGTTILPLTPPWKTRVANAIRDRAATEFEIEVDQVLFPDGIPISV